MDDPAMVLADKKIQAQSVWVESPDDSATPKTQRRDRRKFWICAGLVLGLIPLIAWVAIDQIGKRQWREAQRDLHAKGEASSLDGLNLPLREDLPDEENFCAIPWLIADGSFLLYSIGLDRSDFGGRLTLKPEYPLATRVTQKAYLGDWPWPAEPLKIDTTQEGGKD